MPAGLIADQTLGKFLQIAFSQGLRTQISQDHRDWESIKMVRDGDPNGREVRFLFRNALGYAAVQYRDSLNDISYPVGQQADISENTAVYKELNTTVQMPQNLYARAQKSKALYADIWASEIEAKLLISKRRLGADLYADGTGVLGQVLTAVDNAAADSVLVTLNTGDAIRGHIGFFEYGDLIVSHTQAGAAITPTLGSGTFYAWKIMSRSRKNDQVTLSPVSAAGAILDLTASNLAATHVFYRVGQLTKPDLTSPIADYGNVSQVMAGLESLAAADGRVIHGITMSGATAGTQNDCGGDPLDVSQIQELMSTVKVNVGGGVYSWKKLVGAPEAFDAFIESRETDRRFISVKDDTRGAPRFCYQHQEDLLEVTQSEYCPKKRMYAIPEAKAGNKVLEYHGTDFEVVNVGGNDTFLAPGSGTYNRQMLHFLQQYGTIICKHPAAIGVLRNFTF